jgi:two-component system, OmpR family, phosphate regulon sensor histidine kinase PhoR
VSTPAPHAPADAPQNPPGTSAPESAPLRGSAPESAPLRGSAPESAPLRGSAPESAPLRGSAPESAPLRGSARILVVDDELGVREGCRKILASEGYDVVTAGDGKAGLEQFLERGPFSVLLVDLQMPRMSGLELMREVRSRDPDILPIIITAHATIDTAMEGTRQGAYSYIPKPFTPDELLLVLKNGLERRALTREARRLREEREKRLLEVASERSKSSAIIAAMTDGILVINTEKLVVLRNNAAARMLPDCAHRPIPFALGEISSPDVREIISVVIDAPGEFMILSRQIPVGESTYLVNVSPVIEPGGETSGAVAVFSDVTELKKLDTAKSMFVSLVAHEVKSPLAATEGWLNLILSGMLKHDTEEEHRMLQRALLRVRTLRTMVNELLNLTAIQTGNFTLKRAPVEVAAIVADVVEANRERAMEKGITVAVEGPDGDMPRVLADRDALAMVYSNLVENAIKYTPEGGHVRVRISRLANYVSVAVKDDGIGLSPEDCTKVFDEFYRVRGEKTASIPGTGLGLSLVKRLTELHEGIVRVTSALGEGSEFMVNIPAIG